MYRFKKIKQMVLVLITCVLTLSQTACAVSGDRAYIESHTYASFAEGVSSFDESILSARQFVFSNGDTFQIAKLTPRGSAAHAEHSFFIPGDNIRVSFFDSQQNFVSQNLARNLPCKTLFIQTNECEAMVSIGAVYSEDTEHHTVVPVSSKEVPLIATPTDTPSKGYLFTGSFFLATGECAQMWYLLSTDTANERPFLTETDDFTIRSLRNDNFYDNRTRLCYDGYYFEAPDSYRPYRENMLFRHPSCYTGISFARYARCRLFDELGYVMLRLSAMSQDEQGYWETGPAAGWVEDDFNIGRHFYDTRFNTDFAKGLCLTYEKYQDAELLDSLFRYTQYFFTHAQNNHASIKGGWLVRDYAPQDINSQYKPTHSSLNHHAAEMIFLNEVHSLIQSLSPEETDAFQLYPFIQNPRLITTLVYKMLLGIQNTADYWILPDGNLAYAYDYTGTANELQDYPYLTYNDLFNLNKQIQTITGYTNPTLDKLMASKRLWMDTHGVTGYLK